MGQDTLAIFFPVWNRAELFEASFASVMEQLDGIDASIWIIDNGSDARTRQAIAEAHSERHKIFKIALPTNMGIPYAVNIFSRMSDQPSPFANYRPADYVMIADADCYFKRPIRELIEILKQIPDAGAIAGHDSIEHGSHDSFVLATSGGHRVVKEKTVARGLCLLMRREILAQCVPFPSETAADVDWQLSQRHPNSLAARGLKLLAVDHVVHLGLYDSTWHPVGVPADANETCEIYSLLRGLNLMSPERRGRMENYHRYFGIPLPHEAIWLEQATGPAPDVNRPEAAE
jgi:glycosyltransferase involved in cell wall biosynthesis